MIIAILVVLIVLAVLSIRGALVMLTWNMVMPDLLGVSELSFVNAVGLSVLASVLFMDTKWGNAKPLKKSADKK